MYSDRGVIPMLQEMGVAEANGEVRFLIESFDHCMRSENRPQTRLLCCQIATILVLL